MLTTSDLPAQNDFSIGDLKISPSRRLVEGPAGKHNVEPIFMRVFLRLLAAEGQVVTRRELFEECWGGASVGDDSLNRAIAGVRQIARAVGSTAIELETIPRTGYVLRRNITEAGPHGPGAPMEEAAAAALDCWRIGLPVADLDAIRALDRALAEEPGDARGWGLKALLLRKAVEYAKPDQSAELLQACEAAIRRALSINPAQSDALSARAGVMPMFGDWKAARGRLLGVLELDPGHVPARHDLAMLEMMTGRPSAARPIIAELIEADPLAATFYYKRMYHLWNFGEVEELERVAMRALQLWPRHPGIWLARYWTLLFTGRGGQALRLVDDERMRPPLPQPMVDLLHGVAAVQERPVSDEECERLAERASAMVARGPAIAVAALMALLSLGDTRRALDLAYAYYLGRGSAATPIWTGPEDARVSDQFRRITQFLFLPCAQDLRALPEFAGLCRDLGFSAYWEATGLTPDFCDEARRLPARRDGQSAA
ncbi:tetratricopeptide repeat protein [Sphingomonas humi]|uniref:OmpR/PhoB-type domain-containing protein n=1 Tax=Sphingomonas humi TaxID=335630 RepID=A0ABP7S629_9SPHN